MASPIEARRRIVKPVKIVKTVEIGKIGKIGKIFGATISAMALFILTLTGLGLTGANSASAQEDRSYLLATGTSGGTYYPVGVALATIVKTRLEPGTGIALTAISSAGSRENVTLIRRNEVQFAILQGLWGAYALAGEGPFTEEGPAENLRSVSLLWPNVEHFVIRSRFAKTGTMSDLAELKGRRFSIGQRNSGAEGSGRLIMSTLGIDPDSLSLAYLGYGASADALINGTIDGMNTGAGVPVAAVARAFAAQPGRMTVLGFTPEQIAKINARYNLWSPFTIPPGTYPHQKNAITAAAQPNFLTVRADVDEEAVYQITKTIYENLPLLASIHAATRSMALETALTGLPIPLHPGAARYFDEAGVPIPDALRAP